MEIEYKFPSPQDVEDLISNISPTDLQEILALGLDPEWSIRESVRSSGRAVTAARTDQGILCLFGVSRATDLSDIGLPWMVTTPLILQHRREIIRVSRLVLASFLVSFPQLSNYVDARNTRAIRWLRWLGAKLVLVPHHGPFRRPFYHFTFGEL